MIMSTHACMQVMHAHAGCTSCISRRMTERSRSMASSLRCEFWMMSDRMLIAFGTSRLNTWTNVQMAMRANIIEICLCRCVRSIAWVYCLCTSEVYPHAHLSMVARLLP
jgi:hypothetical protein